ncbi:MAG: Tlg2-vesicle protein [Phylliscum demangeonii]|nr:MAG: Tlg2-vesicle protein [Phylliscum demangeonii]
MSAPPPSTVPLPRPSPPPSPDPAQRPMLSPTRIRSNGAHAHAHAPSRSRSESGSQQRGRTTVVRRWLSQATRIQRQAYQLFMGLSLLQRILLAFAVKGALIFAILFLIYNHRIILWMQAFAERWRNVQAGWTILWLMTFLTAFPPLIGYSTLLTMAGFLYGVPKGWCIGASANLCGSLASFLFCRTLISSYVTRMVERDKRFAALALTLKHDGLKLLVMIRLCPLPYSLSNGALASFPTIKPSTFALATALASPKLLIHIFIGDRLAALAKHGGEMDATTRALNYASIVGGAILAATVAWLIYQKTIARARQLEAEDGEHLRRDSFDSDEPGPHRYDDLEQGRGFGRDGTSDDISLYANEIDAVDYRDDVRGDEGDQRARYTGNGHA